VYLGGFYNEDQAALAYDLAAVRFRKEDAITNFHPSFYALEMIVSETEAIAREDVVTLLRDQSKGMNKVDVSGAGAVCMEPWELALTGKAVLTNDYINLGMHCRFIVY